jgi:hypothetical protein
LEESVYAEGDRKGILWLPEGHFVGELRLMLVTPNGKIGSKASETRTVLRLQIPLTKHAGGGVVAECFKDCSFVEGLQLKARLELEDQLCVEAEKSGVKQWFAVEGV